MTALASMRERRGTLADQIETRAHDLRLAAKGVRILHARAIEVRGADTAPCRQAAVHAGNRDLTGLAADLMDTRIERRIARFQRIDRQRSSDHGRGEHVFRAEQTGQRERGGDLRPVDQRESFLGAEPRRRESGTRETFGRRENLAADAHLADAEQYGAQVRQRSEIAGRPDRALRRNHGIDLMSKQRAQGIEKSERDARMSACQRIDLEREYQPDDGIGQRLPDAGRMREQEIALQLGQLIVGDAGLREQPEARVDPVGRMTGRHDLIHACRSGCDARAVGFAHAQRGRCLVDLPKRRQGEAPRGHFDRGVHGRCCDPVMGRSSPCSRAQSMAI